MSYPAVVIGAGVLFFLLTCWAVIDISRKNFGGLEKKVMWGAITLIPFIGPILYLAVGFRTGKKPGTPSL